MSIELSRVAHFSGSGLPEPVEIWYGHLDETSEVYFTQPYDPSKEAQTVALTVSQVTHEDRPAIRYEFDPKDEMIPSKYRAMLAHAAMYFATADGRIRARGGADRVESFETTGAILRHEQVGRARYLPLPFEERL